VIAVGDDFHFADEAQYADAARKLLDGDGFGATYLKVPGYPVLLALLGIPAPASTLWLRMAQALVAALGTALVFLAADRLSGRASAIAAAVIYALDPLFVVAAALLYPEAMAAVLMLGVVLLAWEAARRDSLVFAALAGSCLGALALFRPVALAVVPVVATWVLFVVAAPPMRRALHGGLIGLACLLVLAPWAYNNYRIHGRLIPVSLAGTRGASVSPGEIEQRGVAGALADKARTDPLALASHVAREFGHFWELVPSRLVTDNPARREELHQRDPRLPTQPAFSRSLRDAASAVSFGIELLLALGGLALLWRDRRREAVRQAVRQAVLLAAVVLVYALAQSLFIGKLRYRITVLPLVFLFAGAAASALYSAIRSRFAPRAA
jgi:4-amino-4-deoxy-L-arabinose transferase-like glycosyltransferase